LYHPDGKIVMRDIIPAQCAKATFPIFANVHPNSTHNDPAARFALRLQAYPPPWMKAFGLCNVTSSSDLVPDWQRSLIGQQSLPHVET
jgi:hypothetical protein